MDLEEFKKRWIGRRVLITGKDHPHVNEVGEVKDVEHTSAGWAMAIEGEYNSFYVFNGRDLKLID
ncbi:hypothetical protein BDE36_1789 [Arcticibacter tournemirensis]|uniref:Uncharacterized protein n=1 Tax=Arcticibacter tournemirensis TaxID=699437 RepID=A0A5M9HFQ1_9SPHI|nr:hypothetical protein [Arcticibacter tournemirensis]KAA8483747.1 hypothetical protein F1649_07615 [Arcticibacter tournemirensis]TQM50054.1 hypothetical protein BDE36_1789 [Arcticibacter tournemirensis]